LKPPKSNHSIHQQENDIDSQSETTNDSVQSLSDFITLDQDKSLESQLTIRLSQ
jgi:hypothetical protein